jgi:hypothetical protein
MGPVTDVFKDVGTGAGRLGPIGGGLGFLVSSFYFGLRPLKDHVGQIAVWTGYCGGAGMLLGGVLEITF